MLSNNRLFSLLLNIQDFLADKEENLFRNRFITMIPERRLKQLTTILSFHNNNYFTTRQLMLYIFYNCLNDEKFHTKVNSWDFKHMDEISKLFTKTRLEKDIQLINDLVQKSKLPNFFDSVMINNSGEMVALELMKARFISPIFVIRFKDKIVRKSEPSDETVRMLRIVDAIERVLKTELI
jgi:hypothetical protein